MSDPNLADLPIAADPNVLDAAEAEALRKQLPDGWAIANDVLAKTFKFGEFEATMAFVNAVADIARAAEHHPDMHVGYNTAKIAWTSHDAGGLTKNDFICAAKCDAKS